MAFKESVQPKSTIQNWSWLILRHAAFGALWLYLTQWEESASCKKVATFCRGGGHIHDSEISAPDSQEETKRSCRSAISPKWKCQLWLHWPFKSLHVPNEIIILIMRDTCQLWCIGWGYSRDLRSWLLPPLWTCIVFKAHMPFLLKFFFFAKVEQDLVPWNRNKGFAASVGGS